MATPSPVNNHAPVDTQVWMQAVDNGDTARVRELLAQGADIDAASHGGKTALMRAASRGNLDIVRLLLDAGANVNAKKENGATALIMAVFFGYADIVGALLQGGADPTMRTPQGKTLEEWALTAGFAEIAGLLKNAPLVTARNSVVQESGRAGETTGKERAGAWTGMESSRVTSEGHGDARRMERQNALHREQDVTKEFFPSNGEFSPVIPLARIDDTQSVIEPVSTSSDGARALRRPATAFAATTLSGQNGTIEAGANENINPAREEQDEATLVPARARSVRAKNVPPPVARRPSALQSWPVKAFALGLILVAGAVADAVWRNSEQPAQARRDAPIVRQDASNPVEMETQAAEAPPVAPPLPEAELRSVSGEPGAVLRVPVADSGAAEAVAPKAVRTGEVKSVTTTSTVAVDRRAGATETGARVTANPSSRERQEAVVRVKQAEAAVERKSAAPRAAAASSRQAQPAPRRSRTQGQVLSSSSGEASLPVSAPPPSKTGSKAVIPWP